MNNSQTRALAGAFVLVFGAGLLAFGLQPYGVYLLSLWAVYTIGATGLNLTLGYAGQVSLAQATFVGIGAYTTAILLPHGVPFGITLLVGAALCFGLGVLLGFPALRVQGHYLAFVTLALCTIAFLVFRNEAWLTGGIYGINHIRRPAPFTGAVGYLWLCLGVLALVTFGTWWLLRSPWGRAFVALRENPVRAASLGVEVRTYTLLAFAIGAALGGVSGSLYASLVQYIEPTPFALTLSFSLLLMVVVGGSGSFLGPYLGALVAVLLPEWLRFLHDYYLVIYGMLVILLLVLCPEGLVGLAGRVVRRLRPAAPAAEPAP
ncbi:MAG TPA: branched-chain amino acid ABC transporter permease [Acetobacteraceae bacterium]|nr:branched-chain amino acid ABC transporter permease [Acetobacteraceae bacterium]